MLIVSVVKLIFLLEGIIWKLGNSIKMKKEIFPDWKNWEKFAAQQFGNAQYYRGLLIKIGIDIGEEAYISDDKSIATEPLIVKIPELVKKLIKENKKLRGKRNDRR